MTSARMKSVSEDAEEHEKSPYLRVATLKRAINDGDVERALKTTLGG